MWSVHDATVNAKAAFITVGNHGFQFIRKFCECVHFSGTVVEILCSGKISSSYVTGMSTNTH